MGGFARWILGMLLLPACWSAVLAFVHALAFAMQGFTVGTLSLLGGVFVFVLVWMALPRPVRTYVLGHELTHALWGLLFGAVPSDLRVSESGGSVRLTKTNVFITLAPYFFPFYTFLVILAALVTYAFVRPLPAIPLWLFMIGFTWAFHVLFTLQSLSQAQPDVKAYGRLFSWTFIFLVNVLIVLVWLACTTDLTFSALGGFLVQDFLASYLGVGRALWNAGRSLVYFITSRI
ncbi:MAG TPA: hypothetical protein DD637_00580 [Verrucomicrobia bacterium]|nr:hypothetical protein [Verrucomicrobiota bacterium]